MVKYLMVMIGAGLGGVLRFIVAVAINDRFNGRFPLATFVINVTGCFGIGLLMTIFTERFTPHPYWRLLLVVGVLGGYTTFSSFEWEIFATRQDAARIGLLYLLSSVCAGYLAVWLGAIIARR